MTLLLCILVAYGAFALDRMIDEELTGIAASPAAAPTGWADSNLFDV